MWVTWNDGTITLGRKTINANHIASVKDPHGPRPYTSLHISTLDPNVPVQWEFDIDAGKLRADFSNFLLTDPIFTPGEHQPFYSSIFLKIS